MIAEVTAMRNGIKATIQAGFTHIYIEGDNKTLIQAVQGYISSSWEIQVLVQDILAYIQLCNKFLFIIFLEKEIPQPISWQILIIPYIPWLYRMWSHIRTLFLFFTRII